MLLAEHKKRKVVRINSNNCGRLEILMFPRPADNITTQTFRPPVIGLLRGTGSSNLIQKNPQKTRRSQSPPVAEPLNIIYLSHMVNWAAEWVSIDTCGYKRLQPQTGLRFSPSHQRRQRPCSWRCLFHRSGIMAERPGYSFTGTKVSALIQSGSVSGHRSGPPHNPG